MEFENEMNGDEDDCHKETMIKLLTKLKNEMRLVEGPMEVEASRFIGIAKDLVTQDGELRTSYSVDPNLDRKFTDDIEKKNAGFLGSIEKEYRRLVAQILTCHENRLAVERVIKTFIEKSNIVIDVEHLVQAEQEKISITDDMISLSVFMKRWDKEFQVDDDLIVENANDVNVTCGILLTPMERPFRNLDCSHVFSEAGLAHTFKQDFGTVKCPQGGCSRKTARSKWVYDPSYAKAVERKLLHGKFNQSQRATQAQFEIE